MAKVRNGFVPRLRRDVFQRLAGLESDACPFSNLLEKRRTMWALAAQDMKECHWLRPRLVAQVEFTEWTPDGRYYLLSAIRDADGDLSKVDVKAIFDLIREHKVTHYCGAPIVHNSMINAPGEVKAGITHKVSCFIAGAAPPVAVIEGMERMGFHLTHVYGLTETYGPAGICAKHEEWDRMSLEERARLNSRQGVAYPMQEGMTVMDPKTMRPVPWDGTTMGEIMFRGNIVMKGYLKNPAATDEAFEGGWFHSGDLAVMEPDGYAKIKDRSKDIIISGGENISSIELEDVLYRHPAVLGVAVVAYPDEKWGEVPFAFVELREGATVSEEEMTAFCRERMARFKSPKKFIFGPLPKTSTGKILKYVLRKKALE